MKTNNDSAYVALMTIEIFIPDAQSLKQKRGVVRGLCDQIRARFNASVAEIGYQDKWQRSLIGVTIVSGDRRKLEIEMGRVQQLCEKAPRLEIVDIRQQWL